MNDIHAQPLSNDVLARLEACDPEERRAVENMVRGLLDMPLLPRPQADRPKLQVVVDNVPFAKVGVRQ